jgi:hypothetical protein
MPRIQVDRVSMLRRADAPPRRAELRPRIQVDRVAMLRRANAPPRRAELRPRIQVYRASMLRRAYAPPRRAELGLGFKWTACRCSKMSRRATELSRAQRRA